MLKLIINKQAFKALTIPSYLPHRPISSTPRRNIDGNSHHDDGHHHDSGSECAPSESRPHATWKDFSHLDKFCLETRILIRDILDYIKTRLSETKAEIKDLGNKTEKKFNKIDGKFDKTDSKIDRIFYGVISGLVGFILKGGFDYYQATKK
ncbi:hypothetical protein HOY82DRAFT_634209 [Tuber indicum]|nr:hypothetical protein HOY82DRAFT_634209 [Tuber indicum]